MYLILICTLAHTDHALLRENCYHIHLRKELRGKCIYKSSVIAKLLNNQLH